MLRLRGRRIHRQQGDESLLQHVLRLAVAQAERAAFAGRTEPAEEESDQLPQRVEAETRNKRHRDTREVKKAIERAERRWEAAEAKVAELQRVLADPDTYRDPEKVRALAADYDKAKDAAAAAMHEWEKATAQLG